jgi:pimeloyl-ACP methyl ester carboxylesterase
MSDWDNVDISFERMVDDLEAVINCYDHEKLALFAASQSAAIATAYTLREPLKNAEIHHYM